MKTAAFLDFETTGLDLHSDEIIEGAVILTELSPEGRIVGRIDEYQGFNDPKRPIPLPIAKLTGISDDSVSGKILDWGRLGEICQRADLIVAHNARFERAWIDRQKIKLGGVWGCSSSMIDWKATHGMPCGTLKHLAWEHKFFPNAHRAMDDVSTLVTLLDLPSMANPTQTYLQEILHQVRQKNLIVFANSAPFEAKEKLRQRRFRWSTSRRVWWKIVKEMEMAELTAFLTKEIYPGEPMYVVSDPVDPLESGLEDRFKLK